MQLRFSSRTLATCRQAVQRGRASTQQFAETALRRSSPAFINNLKNPLRKQFSVIVDGQTTGNSTTPVSDSIVDVTAANFQSAVIQSPVPVILDFHAEWCGPCRQLGPKLEAIVRGSKGALKLCKVNADTEAQLAQGLQVRSLPTVFGIVNGKAVDQFVGMVDDERIATFVDKLLNAQSEKPANDITQAADHLFGAASRSLERGDINEAKRIYMMLHQELERTEDEHPELLAKTIAGMLSVAAKENDAEEVERLEKLLKEKYQSYKSLPEVQQAIALASLQDVGNEATDIETLQATVESNPNDLEALYNLSKAYAAAGQFEASINATLSIIQKDKTFQEGAAKDLLLKLFDSLGPKHPATLQGRRRLSSLLF